MSSLHRTGMTPNSGLMPVTRRGWLRTLTVAAAAGACGLPGRGASVRDVPGTKLTDVQQKAVRAVLEQAVAAKAIPGGSMVLLSRGEVVFREAVGRLALDAETPFTTEVPCFIASVTKPISATFFALLHEQGVISLDDPVQKYLPEFKSVRLKAGGRVATTLKVWHCLSHRSGLPGNADVGDDRPQRVARAATDSAQPGAVDGFSLEEVVSRWASDGLLAEPGTRFAYGSSGYMVAARIAEVVLGARYERLLHDRLLDPLGMRRTTFHPDAATLKQVPARYISTGKGLQRESRTMPLPNPEGLINPAGGLCSRLDDMAAFVALHLNRGAVGGKQFVQVETLARLYRPHPPRATEAAEGGGIGYGLGWNVIAPGGVVRHLGASGTFAFLDLKRQCAGVFLTQVKWGPTNRPLIPKIMKEVQAIFSPL